MRQAASTSVRIMAASVWAGRPLHLQRKCSCGASSVVGECESCKSKKLQRRAAMGADDHPLEAEADRAAAAVLGGSGSGGPPLLTRMTGEGATELPESVQHTLARGGRPLERGTRRFMERRFGADFSAVRVHHDAQAAQSARELQARAYTVGSHIVFGTGEDSSSRSRLLAHELAHTVQQGGSPRQLQRACLPDAECKEEGATLEKFVEETEKKPENITKAEKRKKSCGKTPPDASCTSDGHNSPATSLNALLKQHNPSRAAFITGVFVDKDMPASYSGVTYDCAQSVPTLQGGQCTFIPDKLEAEARLYRKGDKSVGGLARSEWLTGALGILAHETEHARYLGAAPIATRNAASCKFEDHARNLSEVAAHLSEMRVFYREALTRPEAKRFDRFNGMLDYWINNPSESISGIVKHLRCKCECADADHYITKTVESVQTAQKWDAPEAFHIHAALSDAKWKLNWPIKPQSISVNADDMPGTATVPFKLE